MPLTVTTVEDDHIDPIDMIEEMARASDLEAQRVDDTEVHICLTGSWRDISMWFAWRAEVQVMQIGAPLELRVPPSRLSETHKLLALINERMWIGHFDLWGEEGGLIYRHGAVLAEGQGIEPGQAEILLRGALEAFDQYYPAFNYVIWAGKTAEEALTACVLEPVGSA